MKATYKNVIKNKQLIRTALFELLNKKSISEISITEVVKLAEVNRGTFYNHFNNLNDVLIEFNGELMANLVLNLKTNNANCDTNYFVNETINHIKTHEQEYKNLAKSLPSLTSSLKNELLQVAKTLPISLNYPVLQFLIGGMVSTISHYLLGQNNLNLDQISDTCTLFFNKINKDF